MGNGGVDRDICQRFKKAGIIPATHFTVIRNTKEGIRELPDQYLAGGYP